MLNRAQATFGRIWSLYLGIVVPVSLDHFLYSYQEYVLYDYETEEIIIDPFYPAIKYKIPADLRLDGTDYFIVAESMNLDYADYDSAVFDVILSFTCENNQKAFYKLIKVNTSGILMVHSINTPGSALQILLQRSITNRI